MNDQLLDALVPSEEMREFLKKQELDEETLSRLIEGSPAPLRIKAAFANGDQKLRYEKALERLDLCPDDPDKQRFSIYLIWFDHETAEPDLRYIGFFTCYDDFRGLYLDEFDPSEWFSEDCPFYFIAVRCVRAEDEKWTPADAYIILDGEPVWYREREKPSLFGSLSLMIDSFFSPRPDLKLPVPYRAGDLLELNCLPFAPPIYALLLTTGDDPMVLYRPVKYDDAEHAWQIDPLASGPYLEEEDYDEETVPYLSPLYRLKKFEGELPKGNEMLLQARAYIGGDEARGRFLCEHFYDSVLERAALSPQSPSIIRKSFNR